MAARSNTVRRERAARPCAAEAAASAAAASPAPSECLTIAPGQEPLEPAACPTEQILVFWVGGQRYALPIESVREVQRIVAFAGEGFGGPVVGMIDLRGSVIAAVDACILLDRGPANLTSDSQMVILAAGSEPVALLVDQVSDVVVLSEGSLRPAPSRHPLASKALGVVRLQDELVAVLDPEALLESARGPAGAARTAGGGSR